MTPIVNLQKVDTVYGPAYLPVGRLAETILALIDKPEIHEDRLPLIRELGFRIELVKPNPPSRLADYQAAKKLCQRSGPKHVDEAV